MTLQDTFDEILSSVPGTFGISVKNIETEEEITVNEDKPFQLASCFKTPVLVTLFRDVHEGEVDLNTRINLKANDRRTGSGVLEALDPGVKVTIRDLATLMINMSDNVATDLLMELVGTENVDNYMKELGLNISVKHDVRDAIIYHMGKDPSDITNEEFAKLLTERDLAREVRDMDIDQAQVFQPTYDNNTSTPTEMTRLLEMIATKQLISEEACDEMIHILSTQKLRNRIPYFLPPETTVACKTGSVGSVANDAGIVYLPDDRGAFVITAFSRGNSNRFEGDKTIAKVAKAAFDYFNNQQS